MLARSCLRTARAFAGARNGAVQITKVMFSKVLAVARTSVA